MRIVVLDGHTLNPGDISWESVAAHGELTVHARTPAADILARAAGAEIVLTNKTPLTAETIAALPELRYIGTLSTGYNVVDIEAATARGIPVCNVPEYGTAAVAQFAIALLLELAHRIGDHDRAVASGDWEACKDYCFIVSPQTELAGMKFGVVGFGRIGIATGRIAHALGMDVFAHSRSRNAEADYPFTWKSVPEIFAECDAVSLHCPQTPETEGMVNRALLSTMKTNAFLINTARGALVNEPDLAAALGAGTIAGAALDVVSREPILGNNPMLGAPNVILTPHMAWMARSARQRLMETTGANIAAWQSGTPQNTVG